MSDINLLHRNDPYRSPKERRKISKAGCLVCKRRKIKVTGPQFPSPCAVANADCHEHSAEKKGLLSPGSSSDEEFPTPNPPIFSAISLNTVNATQLPDFKMFDLELLHTFTNFTCLSFSHRPDKRALWRVQAPKMGFSNLFVMRGLLAVTALHLGNVHQGRDEQQVYFQYAANMYEKGLHEAAKELPQITSDNATALFLFEAMNYMYTLGQPRPEKPDICAEYKIFSSFAGINVIHDSSSQALRSGPLAALIRLGDERPRELLGTAGIYLENLRRMVLLNARDSYEVQLFSYVIDELEKPYIVMAQSQSNKWEPNHVFAWLFGTPKEFGHMISEYRQEALVIFAYGCVLFKRLDSFWWLEGWAERLISQVYDSLDTEHRSWIQWPLEQIGWFPPEPDYSSHPSVSGSSYELSYWQRFVQEASQAEINLGRGANSGRQPLLPLLGPMFA
ncbi:putative C6 transcription factor [Diplocarpon rosae]|nr:putative C6 transcription factor [Diplocarpon rosae]